MATGYSESSMGVCSSEEEEEEGEEQFLTVPNVDQSETSVSSCSAQYGEVDVEGGNIFCSLLLIAIQ